MNNIKAGNSSELFPVLFFGHGSPMNAIELNEFSNNWRKTKELLPIPNSILCISAHWETKGTFVTAMDKPKTIHDFYGFPPDLYRIQYPAKGNLELAAQINEETDNNIIELDTQWGFDHGCWSVLKHLYPEAEIPVNQLSLDYSRTPQQHYDLAKELQWLRKKGVLIIGSGNVVHNLGIMNWNKPDSGYDWALEANELIKSLVINREHGKLNTYKDLGNSIQLSVPTSEHFLPLLYVLALQSKDEEISFFNDKVIFGSISMTSLKIGNY